MQHSQYCISLYGSDHVNKKSREQQSNKRVVIWKYVKCKTSLMYLHFLSLLLSNKSFPLIAFPMCDDSFSMLIIVETTNPKLVSHFTYCYTPREKKLQLQRQRPSISSIQIQMYRYFFFNSFGKMCFCFCVRNSEHLTLAP